MTTKIKTDVIIASAGPTGLSLASADPDCLLENEVPGNVANLVSLDFAR